MGRGIVLARINRVSEANKAFDDALAASPNDPLVLREAGAFHYRKGDMIDTAGTLCAGADVLLKNGATKIVACATHAVLSGPAIERINSTEALSQVFVTDTIPMTNFFVGHNAFFPCHYRKDGLIAISHIFFVPNIIRLPHYSIQIL